MTLLSYLLLRCSPKRHSQNNNHKKTRIKNKEVSLVVTKHICHNQAVFETALMLLRTQIQTHHSSSSSIYLCQTTPFQLRKFFRNKTPFNFNPLKFQNSKQKTLLRATPETETHPLTAITLIESFHLHSKYIQSIPQG